MNAELRKRAEEALSDLIEINEACSGNTKAIPIYLIVHKLLVEDAMKEIEDEIAHAPIYGAIQAQREYIYILNILKRHLSQLTQEDERGTTNLDT